MLVHKLLTVFPQFLIFVFSAKTCVCVALASATRSNSILNAGFILYNSIKVNISLFQFTMVNISLFYSILNNFTMHNISIKVNISFLFPYSMPDSSFTIISRSISPYMYFFSTLNAGFILYNSIKVKISLFPYFNWPWSISPYKLVLSTLNAGFLLYNSIKVNISLFYTILNAGFIFTILTRSISPYSIPPSSNFFVLRALTARLFISHWGNLINLKAVCFGWKVTFFMKNCFDAYTWKVPCTAIRYICNSVKD